MTKYELNNKIKTLGYEKRSLRIALKRAMQNWSDSDDDWGTDKDDEWERMEKMLK